MTRWLVTLLPLLATVPLHAQSSATGVRDLTFGTVIRGVQTSVAATDPVKSGRFHVRHVQGRQVRLQLTLPNRLDRVGGGGTMNINFGPRDAVALGTAPSSVPFAFNPQANRLFTLDASPDFYLNLGGRVSPAAGQAAGTYTGTVVLTAIFF
jgi:hypothetical protein